MKNILSVSLLVFSVSTSVFAATDVKLNMIIKVGNVKMKPKLIVEFGKTATVTHQNADGSELEVSVTPTEKEDPGNAAKPIDIQFVITQIHQSQRRILSSPRVITQNKARATVESDHSNGLGNYSVSVTPERE